MSSPAVPPRVAGRDPEVRSGHGPDPEVSVLIPLYGDHPGASTLPATARAWLAQSLACEVVVALGGAARARLPDDPRIRVVRATGSAPGPLRNAAARAARGAWLYLSDADVAPIGRDFLARLDALRRQAAALVVNQPWMYRLVDRVGARVPLAAPDGSPPFCLATLDGDRLTPAGSEQLVYDGDDLMVIPPASCCGDGPELRWRPVFHWGGTLLARETFDAAGGYCCDYRGWGCEDDDLVIKLDRLGRRACAWRVDPTIACLHFEHPRPYATPAFARNEALLRKRSALGAAAMIDADTRAAEAPGVGWARRRT